ncbi:MAG: recombinase RecT [Synechococcus sp.]
MPTDTTLEWPEETKKLIAATVGSKLNTAQLQQLQHIALTRGLDPLNSELYAIPKGSSCTFITSINGMLKVVAQELDGIDCTWYDQNAQGFPIWLPKEPPAACSVTVYRRDRSRGVTCAVRFQDYAAGNLWQKMPSVMIRKCALAGALRMAFSDLLGGLYTKEELDQAGEEPPAPAQPEPIQQQQEMPAPKKTTRSKAGPSKKAAAAAAAKASDAAQALADATGGEVVEQPQPEHLEPRQFQHEQGGKATELLNTIWQQSAQMGMNNLGWTTMMEQLGYKNNEHQLPVGHMEKVRLSLNPQKVALFNSGKRTTPARGS